MKKNEKQGSGWYEVQMGKIYQESEYVVDADSGHWLVNAEISGKYDESSFDEMMEGKTKLELGENGWRELETTRIDYYLGIFKINTT